MAKILLIARERNSTVESLVESLETDQQPVYLHLTSKPTAKNFLLMWASFLRLKPDLVYFVFEDDSLNWMEMALMETMGALPYQSTAASFIGLIDYKKSMVLQRFLKKVNLLTLSSRQNLADMRGLNSVSRRQLRALLPPLPSLSENLETLPTASELETLKYLREQKVWILPWDDNYFEQHRFFLESVAKEKTWLFLADRTDWKFHKYEALQEKTKYWKNKPIWSGNFTSAALSEVFKQSEVILLAGHNWKPSDYVQWASLAATSGLFALLDNQQIELFSGLWTVGENCELLEKDFVQQELENRWVAGSLVPSTIRRKPRSATKALDESLNELNRWITKTLTDRKMA